MDTNRPLQFQKRSQLFIGMDNKAVSVVAMRVSNPELTFVFTGSAKLMITLRQVSERDLSEQTLSDRTIRELADWTISSKTAELLLKPYQTEVWSGEAVVHVSIVNWVKGTEVGPKQLFIQKGDNRDSPWEQYSLEWINSALSPGLDVTAAIPLRASISSEACFQGQTHGHEGFLLDFVEAKQVSKDERAARVLHPYLTGDDFLEGGEPTRYVIDLNEAKDVLAARGFGSAFQHVEETVMPAMQAAAEKEQRVSKRTTGPRQSHAKKWWKHWRGRGELLRAISQIPRYIACARVTKRPIFVFVDSAIRPNDALTAFPLADDYSFGILQSGIHFEWFKARCSTLKGDFRYTSDTVFDTFPWPQKPGRAQIKAVAEAGVALRTLRRETMRKLNYSLRDLYRTLEQPGDNPLRDTHAWLDVAVRATYGMSANTDPLTFLLQLNLTCAKKEKARERSRHLACRCDPKTGQALLQATAFSRMCCHKHR